MKLNWKIFTLALVALSAVGLILALWPRSDGGDSEVKGDLGQARSVLPNVTQEKKTPTLSEEELARFRKMAAEYEQMRNMEGPERLLKQAEFDERLSKMTEKEREEEDLNLKIALWTAVFNNPIDFWGKVVDQDGRAIQGAIIDVVVRDDPSWDFEKGNDSKYKKVSDSNGHFEIRNKKGASITVKASAEGYAAAFHKKRNRDLSMANIRYAGEDNNMRHRRPTKDNPTVLVLRKKNPIANLSHLVKSNNISILKDGTPLVIEVKEEGRGFDIEARCWSSPPVPFNYDNYDWSAEIRVLGGKLQPVTEITPIEAPADGYLPVFEVNMPGDMKKNWSAINDTRHFWVQLEDGSYGKIEVEVSTGRDHYVTVESWYNLDGTRNFEQEERRPPPPPPPPKLPPAMKPNGPLPPLAVPYITGSSDKSSSSE